MNPIFASLFFDIQPPPELWLFFAILIAGLALLVGTIETWLWLTNWVKNRHK